MALFLDPQTASISINLIQEFDAEVPAALNAAAG